MRPIHHYSVAILCDVTSDRNCRIIYEKKYHMQDSLNLREDKSSKRTCLASPLFDYSFILTVFSSLLDTLNWSFISILILQKNRRKTYVLAISQYLKTRFSFCITLAPKISRANLLAYKSRSNERRDSINKHWIEMVGVNRTGKSRSPKID